MPDIIESQDQATASAPTTTLEALQLLDPIFRGSRPTLIEEVA